MAYEEGADLMREPDAPGGAYKRYDFIVSFTSIVNWAIRTIRCMS
jgi:hypothetical protein